MTWKNFDLNVFFQGVYGNKIFNGLKFISLNPGGTGQNYNMDKDILNAWTPENTNTNIPRLVQGILPEITLKYQTLCRKWILFETEEPYNRLFTA